MKKVSFIQYILIAPLLIFSGCEKAFEEKEEGSTPRETFDYLWTKCNEGYSFFEYKGIDWNKVYNEFSPKITNDMDDIQLFNELFAMLNKLEDGHVNLIAPFNLSRYEFDQKGQDNYDKRFIRDNYLGSDYYITGPFIHDGIANNHVGYLRYETFTRQISNYDIDLVLARFRQTKGMVIDIRENGGGAIKNVFKLINRLTKTKTLMYNSYIKTGAGPNDFSDAQPAYAEPEGSIGYNGKIVLLTDRGSYSASSFLTLGMRELPNVIVIGDTTGGGLGAPGGGQLPNGWTYRFSVTKTLSPSGENYENGVPPDITVNWSKADRDRGKDSIIERAIIEILK